MEIQCKDCPNSFTLTDEEKKFYVSKGFDLPKRCKSCRQKRKLQKEQAGYV